MKAVFFTLIFSAVIGTAVGQVSDPGRELEMEFMKFEQSHHDSLPQSMYFDSGFCSHYNLKNVTVGFKRMNVWQNPLMYDSKDILRVCDIRWQFKDNTEARAFHTHFLPVNAEFGEEIRNSKISIDNVSELRIFRENENARKMNEAFGSPMNFYYFIFLVDNCVAKVFVNTKPNISVEEAAVFAREAARKLNQYLKSSN